MAKKTICLILLLLGVATVWGLAPVDRLSRRGASGRISIRAGGKHLPGNAEVTLKRTHAQDTERRMKDGVSKRRHKSGGRGKRLLNAAAPGAALAQQAAAERPVNVLAMYDISINADGKKWQPAAGAPVRVDVELDEPVPVTAKSSLGVVHMADDGTVEELAAMRRGLLALRRKRRF